MEVYLVGLGSLDAETFHVKCNYAELGEGERFVIDLQCDLAKKHNFLEELICIVRPPKKAETPASEGYDQIWPSDVICDDWELLEGTQSHVVYTYVVKDISSRWEDWKEHCARDMALNLNDFFFQVLWQVDMTEDLALKLVRHVAEDRERCYDWNSHNEKYQYGQGGLIFTSVVRRWPAIASAFVELITDSNMLTQRSFFNADCGNGILDPLKENVIYYLCDRNSWRHNAILHTPSTKEVCDEDYINRWLPLAKKIVERKAELEGEEVNLNWLRTGCPAAYYQPKLMKMFFPDGVPHDSNDEDLCQCTRCLEAQAVR